MFQLLLNIFILSMNGIYIEIFFLEAQIRKLYTNNIIYFKLVLNVSNVDKNNK